MKDYKDSVSNNCGRPFPAPDCFFEGHFNWCAPQRRAVGENRNICGASSSSICKIVYWGMYIFHSQRVFEDEMNANCLVSQR
jgi:hypothetical protein